MLTPLIAGIFLIGAFLLLASFVGLTRRRPTADRDAPSGLPLLDDLKLDLGEAGMGLSATRFMGYAVGAGFVAALLVLLLVGTSVLALAVFVLVPLFLRTAYLGRLASRRREQQLSQILRVTREIASIIEQNGTPEDALKQVALGTRNATSMETITGEVNQIAEAIGRALVDRAGGLSTVDALRISADRLGNRYYRSMIEVFIRNYATSLPQLAKALRLYAEDVSYTIDMRNQRKAAVALPLMSYMGVCVITLGLIGFTVLSAADAAAFYASSIGQIILLLFGTWLWTGYQLQRRKLRDRY